jgi:hypothetical protein
MASLQGTTITGNVSADTLSGSGASLTSLPNSSIAALGITNAAIADGAIGRANMNYTGAVIQTAVVRYDGRPQFSMPTSYPGTIQTNLRLNITPQYSNSLIIVEYFIAGEPNNHDAGVRITRNGATVTGTYASFNTDSGQNNHSFINAAWYDPDNNSTPKQVKILYYDYPNTTSAIYYEPAFASTDGGTRTFNMNRITGSGGQNNHENGVCFGRITEIRQ